MYESYILICCLTCYSSNVIHKHIDQFPLLSICISELCSVNKSGIKCQRCSLESIKKKMAVGYEYIALNMHAQHGLKLKTLLEPNKKMLTFRQHHRIQAKPMSRQPIDECESDNMIWKATPEKGKLNKKWNPKHS